MTQRLDRRTFLLDGLAAGTALLLPPAVLASPPTSDDWAMADRIARSIARPSIPGRDFDIRDFGARGDGAADDSEAIRDAVDACRKAGGGRVVVRGGVFRTGPIHLASRTELHVAGDATLAFIPEPERYLPPVLTHWEGLEFMGYSPLIYALDATDVAVTGSGVLDGGADRETWWHWKGGRWAIDDEHPTQHAARQALMEDAENGVPVEQRVYADGAYLRPPFIQPFRCERVLIEDVTIKAAPFWLINPVLCRDVTVRGVNCASLGPNSDGCDPESCANVLIENCRFDTGDDCIAIKSGRNADGRRIATPCENIVVRNCDMAAGHGGVVIGSEISGGVRNVFAENLRMSSPDLERGIRIKTNSVRGGLIEHLRYRDITIGRVKDAIVINFYYEEGDAGTFDPTVRDIVIENLVCDHADRVFQVRGFERAPIRDLRLHGLEFRDAGETGVIEQVKDLVVENVRINGKPFES